MTLEQIEEITDRFYSSKMGAGDVLALLAAAKRGLEFERVAEILAEALQGYAGCCDGCTCGDGWDHDSAKEAIIPYNKLKKEKL